MIEKSTKVLKDKKRWQLSLRRYILEQQKCYDYAPYFGLDSHTFRIWIEEQFVEGMEWSNYAKFWQLDHLIPISCFDFEKEEDLKLCWNFINIRPEVINLQKNNGVLMDFTGVKNYFKSLFNTTGLTICSQMLAKVEELEKGKPISSNKQEQFCVQHKEYIENLKELNSEEFEMLNSGMAVKEILVQREIFKKYAK